MKKQTDQHSPFILIGASAGIRAVMKWRFSPALKNGKPIASYIDIKLCFHLER
jgi:hypothetical protein